MRKLFAIGIAAALALSTGVVVFAESSEKTIGGNESQSINVIAKRTDTTENNVVYSVDMKWDDMTFTYHEKSTRVWNPTDHTYSEKIIGGWDKNTADILVTNHSNADVKVGFVYKTAGNTDLTATLDAKAAYADADFVVIVVPTNVYSTNRIDVASSKRTCFAHSTQCNDVA